MLLLLGPHRRRLSVLALSALLIVVAAAYFDPPVPRLMLVPAFLVPFAFGALRPPLAVALVLGLAPVADGVAALVLHGDPARHHEVWISWLEPVFIGVAAGILARIGWRPITVPPPMAATRFYLIAIAGSLAVPLAGYAVEWRWNTLKLLRMMWQQVPVVDQMGAEHLLRAALVLLVAPLWFWLVRVAVTRWEEARTALLGWLAGAFAAVGYALTKWIGGTGDWGPRYESLLDDPNSYGSYLVVTLFVSVALLVAERKRSIKLLATAVLAAVMWMLVLSGSRIALVAALVGVALVPLVWSGRRRLLLAGVVGVVLVAFVVGRSVEASKPWWLPAAIAQVTHPHAIFEDFIEGGRWSVWMAASRAAVGHPTFGIGPGQLYRQLANYYRPGDPGRLPTHENAHNYFLQLAAETGFLGLASFVWLVCWGIRSGPNAPPGRRALAIGATAYLITALTGHPLILSRQVILFWGFVGLIPLSFGAPQWAPAWGRRKIARFGVLALLPILVILVTMRHRPRECPVSSNGGEVVTSGFPMGFYATEGSTKEAWRWMRNAGELVLCNQSKARLVVDMRLRMQSFDVARSLTLYSAGEPLAVFRVTPTPTDLIAQRVILNSGATALILVPLPGPQRVDTVVHNGDFRRVSLRVWEPVTWTPSH